MPGTTPFHGCPYNSFNYQFLLAARLGYLNHVDDQGRRTIGTNFYDCQATDLS